MLIYDPPLGFFFTPIVLILFNTIKIQRTMAIHSFWHISSYLKYKSNTAELTQNKIKLT